MDANSHGWRHHSGQFDIRSRRPEFGASRQPATAELMEHHWQSVIKERDTARRQVLIGEHRRMMNEAQKTDKDRTMPTRASEMGTMMQDSVHRDLRNTVEMHSIMLNMIK